MKFRSARWLSAAGVVLISTTFLGANYHHDSDKRARKSAWTQLSMLTLITCTCPSISTDGTGAGLHQYHGKLEDYSRTSLTRKQQRYRSMRRK